jgi:PAS domain S-box-containing protein
MHIKNFLKKFIDCLNNNSSELLLREKMEEVIRSNEKLDIINTHLRSIIDGTTEGIWAFDHHYNILYMNVTFQTDYLDNFGLRLKIGDHLIDVLSEELKPLWRSRYDRVLQNEQFVITDEIETESGKLYVQVAFYPIVKDGKVIGGSCFGSNVTDRKKQEIALKESEERNLKIVSTVPDLIVITDINGIITFINDNPFPAFKDIPNEAFIGKNMLTFIAEEDLPAAIENTKLMFEKRLGPKEYKLKTDENRFIHSEVNGDLIYGAHNEPIGMVYVIRDISERKHFEKELIAAKEKAEMSDRLKTSFLANMSHEIRTPMNGILGFADLLKEPGLSGEQHQEYVSIIQKSGDRMLNIINDIIDISKIESGLMKTTITATNICEQLEYVYHFFKPEATAKGLQLSLQNKIIDPVCTIYTDKEKVYSILTNLIKNAIKYTHKGEIVLSCEQEGDHLSFFVSDTGIGIPRDRINAIFERFIQADIEDRMAYQGAGLGLAITKAYIEMLGGRIWVESEEGVGSTFYFTLTFIS